MKIGNFLVQLRRKIKKQKGRKKINKKVKC